MRGLWGTVGYFDSACAVLCPNLYGTVWFRKEKRFMQLRNNQLQIESEGSLSKIHFRSRYRVLTLVVPTFIDAS